MNILYAFLAGGGIVFLINCAAYFVSRKSFLAVLPQLPIAVLWILGVTAILTGFWPKVAYVIGSITGAYLSIVVIKRGTSEQEKGI